jgi:hypothetical protein
MIEWLFIIGAIIVLLLLLMSVGIWQGLLFILLFGIIAGVVYWLLKKFFG